MKIINYSNQSPAPDREPSEPPGLLTIPLELRLDIFEHVLATDLKDDPLLFYRHGVIGPIPLVASLCQQLRHEILRRYFRDKTVYFYTFGELGTALHIASSTVPYWRKVHIEWTGRRSLTMEGKRWHLEPGLDMLKKIPNLSHVSLATDNIKLHADTDIDMQIALIADQIRGAIPEHPNLRTFEVTGRIAVPDDFIGRHIVIGAFKRTFTRLRDGTWELGKSSEEGFTVTV